MDPLIGMVIGGRYEVVRLLARGGMGNIYEIKNQRVNRTFVLKTLAREFLSNPQSLARFRREAEVVASFRHPNIVEIVDWETLPDGSPCIIMEHMRGEDLGALIQRTGPLPWRQLAMLADQALSALVVAHRAGIVHRDLKPQNIFVVYDDAGELHAKLLDFGVSKIRDDGSMATSNSELIGTPAYMSPEQAQAKAADIGPASDVWAMGAILHEMASGRVAFEGPNMPAILYRVTHGQPESLRAYRPDAPIEFEQLIYRMLSHDPSQRIGDAHTVRMALRQVLAGYAGDVFHATPPPMALPASLPPGTPAHPSTMTVAAGSMATPVKKKSRLGLILGIAAVLGIGGIVAVMALGGGGKTGSTSGSGSGSDSTGAAAAPTTELGVVYSSEKQEWMEAATAAFEKKHPEIVVKLSKEGSLDAGQAIVAGKEKPVLWSPADSVVLNLYADEWKAKTTKDLFAAKGEDAPQALLLTPIVWVAWEDKAQDTLSWKKLHDAIQKDHLKLGHTDPTLSSTGLLALLSIATEFYADHPLDATAVADPKFTAWMGQIEAGVSKKDETSTGTFGKHMIEFGPSQVEVGVVYESIAVTMFEKAKQRWGKRLVVQYPAVTFWSDHPIALLAGDWVKPPQAAAARVFVAFLRSREIQQSALQYGFRAADVDVPLMTDDPKNPFKKFADNGVKLDIPAARGTPPSPVVRAILDQWTAATRAR